jgi:hypothetical protein
MTFRAAQTALASGGFHIAVTPLPGSTPAAVTKQQARNTALRHANAAAASGAVTATLVSATDYGQAHVATDGTRKLVISNRTAWLVLAPGQQVPIIYPMGKSGPATYAATLALLIDANSGALLETAALNS